MMHAADALHISLPAWLHDELRDELRDELSDATSYASDSDRMRRVIALARANVAHDLGGPFAAAIFERDSGRLVGAGVNSVLRLGNSVLHAEVMAIMFAQHRLGTLALGAPDLPALELHTSCAPCAMCLGAIHWSGIRRVVCGAPRERVLAIGFDEGPVFPQSYEYLARRGVEIVMGVLADDAAAVLEDYRRLGGMIYNGAS